MYPPQREKGGRDLSETASRYAKFIIQKSIEYNSSLKIIFFPFYLHIWTQVTLALLHERKGLLACPNWWTRGLCNAWWVSSAENIQTPGECNDQFALSFDGNPEQGGTEGGMFEPEEEIVSVPWAGEAIVKHPVEEWLWWAWWQNHAPT